MALIALAIVDAHLGKAALPHLSQIPQFSFQTIGKSTLDELHDSLNGAIARDRDQQMQMVRHDYEIMQLKFSLLTIETKHIDQERSVAVRL